MFSRYFIDNPSKVLGTLVTHSKTGRLLTDRFNSPRPEVQGDLQEALQKIQAPSAMRYSHFSEDNSQGTASLSPNKIKQVIAETQKEEKSSKKAVDSAQCSDGMVCLSDSIAQYNTDVEYKDKNGKTQLYTISKKEITIFVTYQVQRGYWDKDAIMATAWANYYSEDEQIFRDGFAEGLTAFDGASWYPSSVFYAGNIYDKIQDIRQNKTAIVEEVGEDGYDEIMFGLEQVKPTPLRFTTDPATALIISPFDRVWDMFRFTEDTDGVAFENSVNVLSVFKRWLEQLPATAFAAEDGKVTSNAYNVRNYYIDGSQFPRNSSLSDDEKVTIKRNATIVGTMLFERFCIEGITRDMQVKIEYLFNSTRNHYAQVQYHRIPVGFQVNQFFKGGKLVIRPAQREGVAFSAYRGTGIVAYDVGVGKTATAILSVEDGLQKGLFKRPLIVTPNGVYWKWVAEIAGTKAKKDIFRDGKKVASKGDLIGQGILPHRAVNTFYNLGVGTPIPRNSDGSAQMVDNGSISMITFDGLKNIGFKKESQKKIIDKIVAALSQSEGGRDAALKEKSAESWVDEALIGTKYDIEDFGFDAIIADECHNFRVLFNEVKGDIDSDGDREVKRFFSTGSGSKPSGRALKLFMLNLYVQSQNKGRNTFGLSATPFTNRATEIYSIMSLFDYDGLKEFGVNNLAQFCKSFIDETSETAWTAQGKFDIKYVIRGYNNLPVLQSLLFRSINYKTGEEAKIKRPEKVVLPLNNDEKGLPLSPEFIINCTLPNTEDQEFWIKNSYLFAGEDFEDSHIFEAGQYTINTKTRKPNGQVLVALNVARVATFSPYAITLNGNMQYNEKEIDYLNFVESSPKIQYTMGCIQSVKDWHKKAGTPVSGQIIYSNTGVSFFPLIKEYLVKEVGFLDEEVAILTGDTEAKEREKIKDGFQDNTIKVLIGSSAIREGMDLQNHCSCIYNLYFDWNPTDLHQLFGRGFRFGNKFSHIRIVNPMVENSSDVFTWQKLSEKIARLNSVWTRANTTKMFEEKELDAEQLKRGLITDPKELAKFEIQEKISIAENGLVSLEAELKEVAESISFQEKLVSLEAALENSLQQIAAYKMDQWQQDGYPDKLEKLQKVQALEYTWDDIKSMYQKLRAFARMASNTVIYPSLWINTKDVDEHIKAKKSIKRIEETVLSAYKVSLKNLPEVEPIIRDRIAEMQTEIAELKSPEYFAKTLRKAMEEKEEQKRVSRSVDDRVKEFARLNYLLDCKFEVDNCDIYGRSSGKTKADKSGNNVTDDAANIGEAIQSLQIALEFSDTENKKVLNEAIQALQIALEFL
jgi:Helicase conserved C-terminal domain